MGFQHLSDSSQDMAQNIIYSPRERAKSRLSLATTSLSFSLFRLFSLIPAFLTSLIKLIL